LSDDEDGHMPLKDHTAVYIQTYEDAFLQIFFDMDDEITHLFTYVDRNLHSYYNRSTGSKSDNKVGVVAGQKQLKCEESEPKMVFMVKKVPYKTGFIAFQTYSIIEAIKDFYEFLNLWGVGGANKHIERLNVFAYLSNKCISESERLKEETEIVEVVLQSAHDML